MCKIKIIYLKAATNLQELKKLYFELSKKHHPDMGGDVETMQQINNEYDYLKTILKNASDTKKASEENYASMDAFKDVINKIIVYPNIVIEIVGSWLWISGKGTFAIKDDVLYNMLHCKYSKAQKKFYWFDGIEDQEGRVKGGHLKKAIFKYGIYTINSEADAMPLLA
jgi:hypothetical protein